MSQNLNVILHAVGSKDADHEPTQFFGWTEMVGLQTFYGGTSIVNWEVGKIDLVTIKRAQLIVQRYTQKQHWFSLLEHIVIERMLHSVLQVVHFRGGVRRELLDTGYQAGKSTVFIRL